MALVPIYIPRTTRPPLGTPIDWSNPLAEGLVGLYPFNETGGAKLFDGNNGQSSGTITAGTASVWSPSGYQFDGSSAAKIDCGNTPDLANIRPITIVALINPTAIAATNFIVAKDSGGGTDYGAWRLQLNTTAAIEFSRTETTSLDVKSSNNSIVVGKWSTVAATWDGSINASGVHLYCNGKETTYITTTSASSISVDRATPLLIGNRTVGGRAFNGSMGFVGIFNRVLSQPEIQTLYSNPWQIYEPEIVWVDLGAGVAGGATFLPIWTMRSNQFIGGGFV
jgi:hypothetical protein